MGFMPYRDPPQGVFPIPKVQRLGVGSDPQRRQGWAVEIKVRQRVEGVDASLQTRRESRVLTHRLLKQPWLRWDCGAQSTFCPRLERVVRVRRREVGNGDLSVDGARQEKGGRPGREPALGHGITVRILQRRQRSAQVPAVPDEDRLSRPRSHAVLGGVARPERPGIGGGTQTHRHGPRPRVKDPQLPGLRCGEEQVQLGSQRELDAGRLRRGMCPSS